jgi:hypothetical protein
MLLKLLKYILVFSCLLPQIGFSQGERVIWRMGRGSYYPFNLNFHDTSNVLLDTIFDTSPLRMHYLNASICDRYGQLLFYTNGIRVENGNRTIILNGDNINEGPVVQSNVILGLPILQGAVFIPHPADSNLCYLFHLVTAFPRSSTEADTLFYSLLDKTGNSGNGAVIQRRIPLHTSPIISGDLTACKHGNGRDWWLVTHENNTNRFVKFLVTPSEIQGPFYQNIGASKHGFGQTCFSPNGQKYASYDNTNNLQILSFDRCDGNFFNDVFINLHDSANISVGCCFSPSSKLLYISHITQVFQFEVDAVDVAASLDTIGVWDGYADPQPACFTTMQLGDDNKIYIAGYSNYVMHRIDQPDIIGPNCNLNQHCIPIPGFTDATVPNLPFYSLGRFQNSICDSLTKITEEENHNSIILYPTVTDRTLYISGLKDKKADIKILSILDETLEIPFDIISPRTIDVSNLRNGLYLLKIQINSLIIIFKFLKY